MRYRGYTHVIPQFGRKRTLRRCLPMGRENCTCLRLHSNSLHNNTYLVSDRVYSHSTALHGDIPSRNVTDRDEYIAWRRQGRMYHSSRSLRGCTLRGWQWGGGIDGSFITGDSLLSIFITFGRNCLLTISVIFGRNCLISVSVIFGRTCLIILVIAIRGRIRIRGGGRTIAITTTIPARSMGKTTHIYRTIRALPTRTRLIAQRTGFLEGSTTHEGLGLITGSVGITMRPSRTLVISSRRTGQLTTRCGIIPGQSAVK